MKIINGSKPITNIIFLCLLGGFIGGFFGSGGGVVLVLILKKLFGDKKNIFPTVILLTLFSSAVNSVFYSHSGYFSNLPIQYFIAGIAGSVCGCIFFDKIKFKFLSLSFAVLTIICGFIMIF